MPRQSGSPGRAAARRPCDDVERFVVDVIYGDASKQNGPAINNLLIDDSVRHLWTSRSSMAASTRSSGRHGRAGRRPRPGHPAQLSRAQLCRVNRDHPDSPLPGGLFMTRRWSVTSMVTPPSKKDRTSMT